MTLLQHIVNFFNAVLKPSSCGSTFEPLEVNGLKLSKCTKLIIFWGKKIYRVTDLN